jgi:hypothetical protein
MKVDINEYPILIMKLNCWPSLVENVHDLGYADAVNKFEENNPDEGGYQYVLDDIYIETEIEVIGMTENRDIICNLLKSEMKGIILKETITNHLISFCDKLFSEISNRSLIDIEFMRFEDINIQLFNESFSANPYKCVPYELAGHFEYIDTINSNKLI